MRISEKAPNTTETRAARTQTAAKATEKSATRAAHEQVADGVIERAPGRFAADLDGRWPAKGRPVHQRSIDRVLSGLPAKDREALKAAQVAMDKDQSAAGAPTHAMRGPGQTAQQARDQANRFVHSELELARRLEAEGRHPEAMRHLGNAMHTLQDATSPSHERFQVWDEKWNSVWSKNGRNHVLSEYYDPGPGSRLDRATQRAHEYFTGELALPTDFFDA